MKLFLVPLALPLLVGCNDYAYNPEVRAERFDSCLTSVLTSTQATADTNWAKVIDSCDTAAYYQSIGVKRVKQ